MNKRLTDFMEWFIGFSEGDVYFGFIRGCPCFCINQVDLVILEYIKNNLGFGNITIFKQKGSVYAQYMVTDITSIESFIVSINGNLFLKKTQMRFEKLVNSFNQKYNKQISLKVPLNSFRLAGFLPRKVLLELFFLKIKE